MCSDVRTFAVATSELSQVKMAAVVTEPEPIDPGKEASSDEDTEDASEPEMFRVDDEDGDDKTGGHDERLTALKEQLRQIDEGSDPEFQEKVKELKELRDRRIFMATAFRDFELRAAQEEFDREQQHAIQEFENKKLELKDGLLLDLQEKKKTYENLRASMEITTGAYLFEPKMTRKLRRRHFDPIPSQEKRRKSSPLSQLVYELDESEVEEDLKVICNKSTSRTQGKHSSLSGQSGDGGSSPGGGPVYEARVEDGRLNYEGKWFAKNQHVIVECKDTSMVEIAIISSISQSEVWLKTLPDHNRMKVYLSQLTRGKYLIRRKSS